MAAAGAVTTTAAATFLPRTHDLFLNLLSRAATLSHLTQIHAQLLHHGSQNDIASATKLTHRLFDFNAVHHARSLFFTVPEPDRFLCNVLVKGLASSDSPRSAISVFSRLRASSYLGPDKFTYAFVIPAAASLGDVNVGVSLHGQVIVGGFGSDLFIGSALVDLYFKLGRVDFARKVFDELPKRDTVLCNAMISGLWRGSRFEDSVRVFEGMHSGIDDETKLDCTTVISVLPAIAELQDLRLGMEVHCLAIKFGFCSHVSVLTGLISLYTKCGDVETGKVLFRQIGRRDLISCNAMIAGFTCNGETESAVRLFRELLLSGVEVNPSTVVGMIPVHSPFGNLLLTDCIHGFSIKSGMVSRPALSTALTTIYSRLNEMESARRTFNDSSEKTLASWNAMISGYTQNGLTEAAVSLFQVMQMSQVSPNPVTVTSILSACAQLGALSLGQWVHGLIRNNNFESNIYVSTALIDMYAKCGSIVEARRLFDLIPNKNEVTWNAMISGYGLHGHGQEALKLFYEMVNSGISLSGVTFLSILYACSHSGLVKEGDEIFKSMIRDHGFEPISEHYACMVDILGRAGKLEEALEFIKGIPGNPSPPIWSTLLGACMIHKDMNMARLASEKLFELDPENMGYYVLMSNIYSSERNYPGAASVRQVAKKKKLAKTPGCTLVEIHQTPHVFKAGDWSHPQSTAIHAELEKLNTKMKEAGYQADTITALHDVEEEEKELMVKVHSEKIAIAFGLISTEPGTEIRIFKNLRICQDCHTASKYISKITHRVIIARDANRFHHFKDGACSCGDYW
ncbi:Pentatricopeptide repeat-containing protein At4g30700 [Linum perenne]